MITLYDADRCPYCARVRIVLAEKGIEYETVELDLDDRPRWIYEKNPLGRVPILEEDTFVLAESAVIDEYLDERYPDYGFARHMGYSTAAHFAAIRTHGPSPVHRRSFAPVRAAVRGVPDAQLPLGPLIAE